MKKVNLKNHAFANCHVLIDSDKIILVSYTTDVIIASKINNNKYTLTCTGLYSDTTRRHISWFISEYFGNINYYVIKDGFENDRIVISELTKKMEVMKNDKIN